MAGLAAGFASCAIMPVWFSRANSAKERRGKGQHEGGPAHAGNLARRRQTTAEPTLNAAIVPVTPFQQNCTLIWDPSTMQGAVVDPGGDLDSSSAPSPRSA